jgi:hypothetical protein
MVEPTVEVPMRASSSPLVPKRILPEEALVSFESLSKSKHFQYRYSKIAMKQFI